MKKLLVLIPAIGISVISCQKQEVETPANNKGIDLRTIQGPVIATRLWDLTRGDCFPNGNDCLDEVTCTPTFWDYFWDAFFRYRQGSDEAVRDFATIARSHYDEPNNQNDALRILIGDDVFDKVLSGELLLKVRLNANNEDMFLGIFDASNPDQVKLVIPLTKPE